MAELWIETVVRHEDDRVLVDVRGEVDILTAPQLAAVLEPEVTAGKSDVVVDLGELEFIDASGLHVLQRAHQQALRRGRRLVLRSPPRILTRILEVTALHRFFNIDT